MARIQARPDPLLEDRSLLADFKEGKPSALTRTYTEYLADLVGFLKSGFSFDAAGRQYAFRGYKEPWHLENAVQEVFIRAFSTRARVSYDGVRPYRNYLFRIAKNTVMDDFRKQKSDLLHIERTTALDECEVPQEDAESGPEQRIIEQQLQVRIEEFAAGLNDTDRALFDVRFAKGEISSEEFQKMKRILSQG